jgi:hypothetical protein
VLSQSLATLNQRQVRTLNAHHTGSLPMQLEVVWSLCLYNGSEGAALISCAVVHTIYIKARSWRTIRRLHPPGSQDLVNLY